MLDQEFFASRLPRQEIEGASSNLPFVLMLAVLAASFNSAAG
jgi:hypothetical protein